MSFRLGYQRNTVATEVTDSTVTEEGGLVPLEQAESVSLLDEEDTSVVNVIAEEDPVVIDQGNTTLANQENSQVVDPDEEDPEVELEVVEDGMKMDYSLESESPSLAPVATVQDDTIVEFIDDGNQFGYQCVKVVEDNTLTKIPVEFFFDLTFPDGAEKLALKHVQEQLVKSIALEYGISNGQGCEVPAFGKSWVVQILSELNDWNRDSVLDTCKELDFDDSTQDCYVYQAKITGGVLAGSMDDVLKFVEGQLLSDAAASLLQNSPYQVQFLGVPQVDPESSGDAERGALAKPTNVTGQQTTVESGPSRQTFTVVGGILVAAFCFAFVGIGFVLYRRRQERLRERDSTLKYDPNKSSLPTDDDEYGLGELRSDLYGEDSHLQMDSKGQVVRGSNDELDRENITFDMGSTFKDQLMGVYGSSAAHQRQQHSMYGMGRALSMDSDADSWAQTEGTIGSIEQHLEPLESEV